ncbi:ornithine cyclodeaminase family protein [Williamsia sp.]|uniref:ornithine cyclodeaminase family protein n=1 Tax=Williamsia sp. TaxID=1872085 RepID=UPI001A1F966C|nr:ornithine cyclodeaminase family protein [Williamsia sp.]MBJ7289231.1 ornithine cyclodeaminase family protein [Williamsia sp.]
MTLVLRHSHVAALLDRVAVLDAVEQAHSDLNTGGAQNPRPISMHAPDDGAVIGMAAELRTAELVAVKVLSDLPGNPAHGRPRQRSTIVVTSSVTGECIALIDGRAITAMRTAATSAVATKHLARADASTLGFVGAGNLAVEHARSIALVRPIDRIVVWSRSPQTVDGFREKVADMGIPVVTAESVDRVAAQADIVCTLTPSVTPILFGESLRSGMHVNAVGAAPRPDEREVDSAAMARSRIVVDSRATALAKSGDAMMAIAGGAITEADIAIELGDVISGRTIGRRGDDDITLFDSTGIGLQDLAAAALVIDRARATGVGTDIDMSA